MNKYWLSLSILLLGIFYLNLPPTIMAQASLQAANPTLPTDSNNSEIETTAPNKVDAVEAAPVSTLSEAEAEPEPVTEPEPEPEPEPDKTDEPADESDEANESNEAKEAEDADDEETSAPLPASKAKPFDTEPYTQNSLNDLAQYFSDSRELAQKLVDYQQRALAIIAGSSNDRNFRRHSEYLTRVAGVNLLAAELAQIIMPRLFELGNQICERTIKTLMDTFTDELIAEPNKRRLHLNELSALFFRQWQLSQLLRELGQQLDRYYREIELQNSRRHLQGQIPSFLRGSNRKLLQCIRQQHQQFNELLNQYEEHYSFCQVNLEYFLAVSEHTSGVMQGAQLSRLLRSYLDFGVYLSDYHSKYQTFRHYFSNLIDQQSEKLEKLVGNNSQLHTRINSFAGKFPERDLDQAGEPSFCGIPTLFASLALLDRLLADETEISSDASMYQPIALSEQEEETFAIVKSELQRHLDSANWPLEPLPEPEEDLDFPFDTDEYDDDVPSPSESDPELNSDEDDHQSEDNDELSDAVEAIDEETGEI